VPVDPLSPLLALPGVAAAAEQVRAAVDGVYRLPQNRRDWPVSAAAAAIRAAQASAVLDGAVLEGAVLEGGRAELHATDPVLAGAVRVAEGLGGLLATWRRAPLQVLARLHVLAAVDLVADRSTLGRPRHADEVSQRLQLLASLLTGHRAVPAVVLAAVVHGELLALAPFGTADGVVARAASRLTAISMGLDAKGLVVPEVGHLRLAAEYRSAAAGFATGDPAAVAAWLRHCCQAWLIGAREATALAAATRQPRVVPTVTM
jgi:hypothetical protein